MAEKSYSSYLTQEQQAQEIRVLTGRIQALEKALLLLAVHVGATGWNYDLQQALDAIRYPPAPPPVEGTTDRLMDGTQAR